MFSKKCLSLAAVAAAAPALVYAAGGATDKADRGSFCEKPADFKADVKPSTPDGRQHASTCYELQAITVASLVPQTEKGWTFKGLCADKDPEMAAVVSLFGDCCGGAEKSVCGIAADDSTSAARSQNFTMMLAASLFAAVGLSVSLFA